MIFVLEEDWGVGTEDYYPPKDKYGWRDFGDKKKSDPDESDKEKSLWDKFWNRG